MTIASAITTNFKSIREMQNVLRTNKDCIKFLEALIWDGVPVSPFDKTSKVYKCKNTQKTAWHMLQLKYVVEGEVHTNSI